MKKLTAILLSICMIASFATVASAESTPILTFISPTDGSVLAEGESLTLTASLSSVADVSSVVFKLGTKTVKTFEPDSDLSCEIVQLDAGEYTFTAEATNALGALVATDTASVTVEPDTNTAPTITTSLDSDQSGIFSASALSEVQLNFEDSDGIASVKAWLNGKVVCDKARVNTVVLNLSDKAVAGDNELKIVASDRNGKEASLTKTFKAVLNEGAYGVADVVDGVFPTTNSASGILWRFNGASTTMADDDGDGVNDCIRYSLAANPSADPANFAIAVESNKTVSYVFESKIKFVSYSKFFYTARPGTGGADYEYIIYNVDGTITVKGSGGTVTTDTDLLSYTTGKWYATKLIVRVDTTNNKTVFDYYVDGKAITTDRSLASTATGISYLKWRLKEVAGEIYIDDASISYLNDLYVINSVSSSVGETSVDGGATTLYAVLSKDIATTDLTDLVGISGEMGDITVDSATYDSATKTVAIITADPLGYDENYVLTIDGDVLYHDNIKVGRDVVARFKTGYADFGIVSTGYTFEDGSLCFNASLANNGENVDVVGVTTVWEGATLVGIYANKASVTSPATNLKVTTAPLLKGQSVESYVFYSDLSTPVSAKTFGY